MGMETALARAEAQAAAEDWAGHKRQCPRCTYRARIRDWEWLCPIGTVLRCRNIEAQAELAENRRLDKHPIAGQQSLF
jgi:hypothetical protein